MPDLIDTYVPVSMIDSLAFKTIQTPDINVGPPHYMLATNYEKRHEYDKAFKEYYEILNQNESIQSEGEMERDLRIFAESKELKAGQLIHPLRLALTGITISPGIFGLIIVLGKDRVASRIQKFINPFKENENVLQFK